MADAISELERDVITLCPRIKAALKSMVDCSFTSQEFADIVSPLKGTVDNIIASCSEVQAKVVAFSKFHALSVGPWSLEQACELFKTGSGSLKAIDMLSAAQQTRWDAFVDAAQARCSTESSSKLQEVLNEFYTAGLAEQEFWKAAKQQGDADAEHYLLPFARRTQEEIEDAEPELFGHDFKDGVDLVTILKQVAGFKRDPKRLAVQRSIINSAAEDGGKKVDATVAMEHLRVHAAKFLIERAKGVVFLKVDK